MYHFRLLLAILVLHQIFVTSAKPADRPRAACKCGQPNRSTRIQGGVVTEKNEYPWQAALVILGWQNTLCGATVISSQHVLTAARCCEMFNPNYMRVVLREHDTGDKTDGQMYVQASSKTIHPQFSRNNIKYDLCVVKLATSIDFTTLSNRVAPICLPKDTNQLYVGQTGVVSGWGRTGAGMGGWGGTPSPKLQEASVNIVGNSKCPPAGSHSSMLCTTRGPSGPCRGDMGSPLAVENSNSRYELVGVVSAVGGWTRSDGSPRLSLCTMYSQVYARVTAALSWINQETTGATKCP